MMEQQRTIHAFIPYVPAVGCFVASLVEPWGKMSAVLSVGTGVALLIVAIFVRHNRQNREKRDELDDLIACMNEKRHDLLNHIQVMMGYLSLNKVDRLQPYLKQIMSETKRESNICHLGYSPLSYYLLTHKMLKNDLVLDVHIVQGLKIENDRQGARLLETIQEFENFLRQTCRPLPEQPLKIGMTMASHGNDIFLYIDLPDQPQQNRDLIQADWTSLCRKVSSWDGEVFLDREEPVVECAVRIS